MGFHSWGMVKTCQNPIRNPPGDFHIKIGGSDGCSSLEFLTHPDIPRLIKACSWTGLNFHLCIGFWVYQSEPIYNLWHEFSPWTSNAEMISGLNSLPLLAVKLQRWNPVILGQCRPRIEKPWLFLGDAIAGFYPIISHCIPDIPTKSPCKSSFVDGVPSCAFWPTQNPLIFDASYRHIKKPTFIISL